MKIVDSKGRLFGKFSILDLGAALVILMTIVGIFFFPGTTGSVAQNQVSETKPVEVEVIVRGLSVLDPNTIINEFNKTKKTNLIIRNQPFGTVEIKKVTRLPRTLAVPQPDGSVKALPDPRQEEFYSANMRIVLGGKATITEDGAVLGNSKLKIGSGVELEGLNCNCNASVIDIRLLE